MATFRNTTTDTLSLGTVQLAPNATVIDTDSNITALRNVKYFYEADKLTLEDGTPDFTRVTVSEGGVIKYSTAQWASLNPVLDDNVIGVDTTTGTMKVGNGISNYSALDYVGGVGDVSADDTAYDATTWNGDMNAPTKNALRDKIEALQLGGGISAAMTWRGTWISAIYEELDAVEYEGSAYIANDTTEVTDVPGVSSKWDLWIAQGPAWSPEDETVFDFGTT